GVKFTGQGLVLRVSEVQRRLQFLRLEPSPSNRIVIGKPRIGPENDPSPKPGRPAAASDRVQEPVAGATRVDVYRLMLDGPFRAVRGRDELVGDQLTAWFKLFDGGLRDGAVSRFGHAQADTPAAGADAGTGEAAPDAAEDQPV